MEFSRQEYWSALPFPSPGDLLDPGIEPTSPPLHVDSLPLNHLGLSLAESSSKLSGSPSLLCQEVEVQSIFFQK